MADIKPIGQIDIKELPFEFELEDPQGVAERFAAGFGEFMGRKKREAVEACVSEEFPQLAEDNTFINKVMSRLEDCDLMDEQRFVFLVKNPNRN